MEKLVVHSVSELMDAVGTARRQWHLDEDEELWFRGEDQKHKATTLVPKLCRHLPGSVRAASLTLLKQEREFFDEFARRGLEIHGREADGWDWYLLMQHHRAPTRLLDWTDGAMTGLHFATNGDLSQTKGGFVYMLDPFWLVDFLEEQPFYKKIKNDWKSYREWRKEKGYTPPGSWVKVYLPGQNRLKKTGHKPALPEEPIVMNFALMTRRISAQHSRLIVMGSDPYWLWSLEKKPDARIKRIEVPKNKVPDVRIQLRDAGISESVIFPDLDGLGRELDQLWDQIKKKKRFNK